MQKSFDVTGPAELEIRLASGDIEIDPSLDGRVEIELTAHDEESQRLVDDARIEQHDQHVTVDVPNKRGGFSFGSVFGRSGISCRVRCPEGSRVTAKTKSADVTARGRVGGVTVQTASGDVEAVHVLGSVNVKSASGDVTIEDIAGSLNVQTASGDIDVGVVRGASNIATASGDIEIREAYDNVHSNTVSGDNELRAVMTGTISANSVSGDVTIGVRRGSKVFLDCNTVSGDTSSELELSTDVPAGDGPLVEVRAKTVSGDIRITRAPAAQPQPPVTDDAQEVHA